MTSSLSAGALLAVLTFPTGLPAQSTGRIEGRVKDAETNAPLEGAQVVVQGAGLSALTNGTGQYVLESVPAGKRTLVIRRIAYYAREYPDIAVAPGETTTIDVDLAPVEPPGYAPIACPEADDTLWVDRPDAKVPRSWMLAVIISACGTSVPVDIRSRLLERVWDARETHTLYASLLAGQEQTLKVRPSDTAKALQVLAWYAPLEHGDVLLRFVQSEPTSEEQEHAHMPFAVALHGLVRYARHDAAARRRILQVLRTGGTPWVRERAFYALLRLNNGWAREHMVRVPAQALTQRNRALRDRALDDGPCAEGTYWRECFGIEGQRIHGCARREHFLWIWSWCAF